MKINTRITIPYTFTSQRGPHNSYHNSLFQNMNRFYLYMCKYWFVYFHTLQQILQLYTETMKAAAFWDVILCSLKEVHWHFITDIWKYNASQKATIFIIITIRTSNITLTLTRENIAYQWKLCYLVCSPCWIRFLEIWNISTQNIKYIPYS
jgi:hypothetical protein